MKMCRHLLCDQKADFQVTVNRAGASKTAAYCTRHLAKVTEAIGKAQGATTTNIRPIEKGPTMTDPTLPTEVIAELKQDNVAKTDRITRLEHDVNRQAQVLAFRDQMITNLEHDNSQLKVALNNRDAKVDSLTSTQEALVSSLHVLADNAEDEGQQDLAEEIDALLAEHDLKPRKQEYTIEILVPTRLHLHVTARSMNHARALYEAGDIDWNVTDGEVQDDDIKVLDISEGSL